MIPEERLRDAFDALSTGVRSEPNRYPRELAQWRRRERRRRLVVAILAAVVFALADIIGLWARSQATTDKHIIFDDTPGISDTPNVGPLP
jgi:hypothetical protein